MKRIFSVFFLLPFILQAQELTEQERQAFARYYGKKPAHLEFNALTENIDSLYVKRFLKQSAEEPDLNYLDPDFPEFMASLTYKFHPDYERLREFQNFFRWVRRYTTHRFVLINIAAQTLTVYEQNIPVSHMRVIVGTRQHKTPTMATVADAAVVYPYWTATRNIAVNEILPKVKADINYLERNHFEVLNAKGQILDPYSINWADQNSTNFSYRFRQGTGCENSLGLLKINIRNPYSVYMHDTPHTQASQSLFEREHRYFSHGCIRLQKPLELVNLLQPVKKIDDQLMTYCLKNQKPETIELTSPVPVFIMYFTDYIDGTGQWQTTEDHYRLQK